MSRSDSPYIVGEFWLDKRRDGKAPEIWQVARYNREGSRSIVYKSTKCRTLELEEAKTFIRSFEAEHRSKNKHQHPKEVELLPHLFHYCREQGPDVVRLDTIKSSFRAWIGFLQQDELGTGATIADVDKNFVARFRRWRMGPHAWEVEWSDKVFRHQSQGVSGKAVQRNIEDLRAALHHGEANNRFVAPKIPSVSKHLRQRRPRPIYTLEQLGAIIGYAKVDVGVYRELCLMLATGCRPGHAMAFNPAEQWLGDILDLQPARKDLTDKRAAVLPVIAPLKPILRSWEKDPHNEVKSRKRFWRTMRRAIGLEQGMDPYSIRTTVSTYLDEQGVPGAQLSGVIGHLPSSRGVARTTSEHYLHYDPRNAARAKEVLTELFERVTEEANIWCADHFRTTPARGRPLEVRRRSAKVLRFKVSRNGGR